MSDAKTLAYLKAVEAKLVDPTNEILTTVECTECDGTLGVNHFNRADHFVLPDAARGNAEVVVIGCQGYFMIDPASVGIEMKNWFGIEGVNI